MRTAGMCAFSGLQENWWLRFSPLPIRWLPALPISA